MKCTMPGLPITDSQSSPKPMSIESVMPPSPLLLPPIPPSIRDFSNESTLRNRWTKYWSFSFSISPSNEYSGLTSFRMDWLDLLAVPRDSQESSPAPQFESIISLVFSLLYDPILISIHDYWKNYCFDIWTFIGKVISLLFITLSRFVIAFLPRSKCLLISWLQSPSAVILELKKIKSVIASIFFPIFHQVMGLEAMIIVFWMLSFKPTFSLSSLSSRGSLVLRCFLPLGCCYLHIWSYWYFSQQSWFQIVLHPAWHFTWYTLHIS